MWNSTMDQSWLPRIRISVRRLRQNRSATKQCRLRQGASPSRSARSACFKQPRAFSSEVDAGWREENASKQKSSVVDLTFDSVSPRVLRSNVKSKTTLESDIC